MADYQEYRRRVLHRRWRRRFMAAGLLFLLVLLGAVDVMWKRLHRDPAQARQDTILQEITEDNTWNTLQYASTRPLTVQTLSTGTTTALDFRMAALPRTAPVEKSWFSQVSFVGDSLTQGMQMYDTGLPGAMFCAYRGVGPNAIVNGTSCKRADGVAEVPLDALAAQQPKAVYLLLGTNVLGTDSDYTSFLTYYRVRRCMCSPSPRCGRRWLRKRATRVSTATACAASTMSWPPWRWKRTALSSTCGRCWPTRTAT